MLRIVEMVEALVIAEHNTCQTLVEPAWYNFNPKFSGRSLHPNGVFSRIHEICQVAYVPHIR